MTTSSMLTRLLVVWAMLSGGALASQLSPVNESDHPLLRDFQWRSMGPANMGGRIDDIAVVESNPYVMYLGFATGGVWKTTNNGTTWAPVFDTYATSSVGDVAVCQSNPEIVWVGTGEANNRQSSSFGDGIYKSTNGGRTFQRMGLEETQTIARIRVHPENPDVVYVAAPGHLFGPNPERGIYRSADGGATWARILFVDDDTGFTDIVMHPKDNNTLFAASYQRRRTPWGFNGGGPGSGIWKTADGGETWIRLSGNGLPDGIMGRVGLAVSRSKAGVIYAQIEVGFQSPRRSRGRRSAKEGPPDPQRSGVWLSEDAGETWHIRSNNNNRPMYYSQIRVDPNDDQTVYTMGASFYKSIDGGRNFEVVGGIAHADHHALWINPHNSNHLVLGNDGGLDITYDQGRTWEFVNNLPVGQFYAIGVDMRKPYYVYGGLQDNGSWGAPSRTRSALGITNMDWFRIGGGDGFYVQIDPADYNNVYLESQYGNVVRLDLATAERVAIRPRSASPERRGRPGRFGRRGPARSNIVPEPPEGERYRFNWNTPIHLSPHNPHTLYVGANKLFKSVDRGEIWMGSEDLTRQIDREQLSIMGVRADKPMLSKHDGTASYGTIVTIAESAVLPGVIWVGTDDGNVQLSRDGARTWTNVRQNIGGVAPMRDDHQVSRVEPSRFDAATCYVSIDGHRSDDLNPYVFVTRDYGETWRSLSAGLPKGNVNVIRQDPRNKEMLYLGTEFAFYISLDGGKDWHRFMNGLPSVRVDDILVHPRDSDLIVGTHGRSIFVVDDIGPLQQLGKKALESDVHLFDVRPATRWREDVTLNRTMGGAKHFRGRNPPFGPAVGYFLKSGAQAAKIEISDIDGRIVRSIEGKKTAGLNRVRWDLRRDPPPPPDEDNPRARRDRRRPGPVVASGTYFVKLSVDGNELTTKIRVEEDH